MRNFLGRRRERDRGAALVEFAMLMPLLLVMVMGVVEFGYTLAQHLDVRHGAREVSRMIATDDWDATEACDRMDLATGVVITLSQPGLDEVGAEAGANVTGPLVTITGFFDGWLPATLTSDVRVRMEQPRTTWAVGALPPCL